MGPELGYNIFSADEVLKSTEKKVFKGAVVRDWGYIYAVCLDRVKSVPVFVSWFLNFNFRFFNDGFKNKSKVLHLNFALSKSTIS